MGVSHLFVVPSIRTSHYVHMLSSAFPSLNSTAPGEIQVESLPNLRHLVVFDDAAASVSKDFNGNAMTGVKHWQETRAAVDFREALLWNESSREGRTVQEMGNSLGQDEVVNLQFTRCVLQT